eukprot:gene28553-31713_t
MITTPSQSHSLATSTPEQRKTLDVRHNHILKSVRDNKESASDLKNHYISVISRLDSLKKNKPRNEWSDEDFECFSGLSDEAHSTLN